MPGPPPAAQSTCKLLTCPCPVSPAGPLPGPALPRPTPTWTHACPLVPLAAPHICQPFPSLPRPCPSGAQHLGCLLLIGYFPLQPGPSRPVLCPGTSASPFGGGLLCCGSGDCPQVTLCLCTACLGVCSPHPGRGLQRKAGSSHPTGAALPALWPGGALHQRHRQCRGPADAVSAAATPAQDPLIFPPGGGGSGLVTGWVWV